MCIYAPVFASICVWVRWYQSVQRERKGADKNRERQGCVLYCHAIAAKLWKYQIYSSWWRHQMKKEFRVTGLLCGEFTGSGEFPTQRPMTRSFDVFFDLRLNKRLSKQPWGWWFETPSRSLWRQCYELTIQKSWGDITEIIRYTLLFWCYNKNLKNTYWVWHACVE